MAITLALRLSAQALRASVCLLHFAHRNHLNLSYYFLGSRDGGNLHNASNMGGMGPTSGNHNHGHGHDNNTTLAQGERDISHAVHGHGGAHTHNDTTGNFGADNNKNLGGVGGGHQHEQHSNLPQSGASGMGNNGGIGTQGQGIGSGAHHGGMSTNQTNEHHSTGAGLGGGALGSNEHNHNHAGVGDHNHGAHEVKMPFGNQRIAEGTYGATTEHQGLDTSHMGQTGMHTGTGVGDRDGDVVGGTRHDCKSLRKFYSPIRRLTVDIDAGTGTGTTGMGHGTNTGTGKHCRTYLTIC